jgi:hypothetical protein
MRCWKPGWPPKAGPLSQPAFDTSGAREFVFKHDQ